MKQAKEKMPIVGHCRHCGRPLKRKTASGRFPEYCQNGGRCRQAAYRRRQKEKQSNRERSNNQ